MSKKHIPVEFSGRSAEEFVVSIIERRRKIASQSGKRGMDAIVEYAFKKKAITGEHRKKYQDEKDLP